MGLIFLTRGKENYDASAQALFSRMTTQPNAARKSLISNTIVSLKSAGIWNKLDILYMMAAHDSQAAGLNWKNASYTLNPVNSPTFTLDRGYAGDGSSSYLDTLYDPSINGVQYTQNSASIGLWMPANGSGNSLVGWFDGTKGTNLNPRDATDRITARVNAAGTLPVFLAGTVTDRRYLTHVSRPDSAGFNCYKNGTNVGSFSRVSDTPASGTFNISRSSTTAFSTGTISMFFAGGNLTDAESTSLYSIANTYMTAVGAV